MKLLGTIWPVSLGLCVGMAFNMLVIQLNTALLFPIPPELDPKSPEDFNAYLEALPHSAFVLVLLAHLGQALIGGLVAARLSKPYPLQSALAVGALSLSAGVLAMTMLSGPTWLIVELPLYLVCAWFAGAHELARRRRAHAL